MNGSCDEVSDRAQRRCGGGAGGEGPAGDFLPKPSRLDESEVVLVLDKRDEAAPSILIPTNSDNALVVLGLDGVE